MHRTSPMIQSCRRAAALLLAAAALVACATFTARELCCRAAHGRVGGPERCRYALGLEGVCGE